LVITYHQKGIEFRLQNETDSAIVYFKKALNIDPTDIPTYESLVKTYWLNDQPELALEVLDSTPSKIRESISILTFMGMTLEKMNKLNEAMKFYEMAFNLSPKIQYNSEEDIMEYIGYLTLQTIVGEKEKSIADLKHLKSTELTEAEKQYVNLIEPLIQNYRGGGYTEILGSR